MTVVPYQRHLSRQEDQENALQFKSLNTQACMCETATKVIGCACCLALWPITGSLACLGFGDQSFGLGCRCIDYSTRLPHKDPLDLYLRVLDPCICHDVLGCHDGSPLNYLPPEKQQMWIALAPRSNVHDALFKNKEEGITPDLTSMILEYAGKLEPAPKWTGSVGD